MHDAGSQDIGYLKGFMIGERSQSPLFEPLFRIHLCVYFGEIY